MEIVEVKNEVSSVWNKWAPNYDEQYAHGIKTSKEKQAWINLLNRELGASGKEVLDVGTGTGFLALMAAGLGHNCLGIDLSQEMMKVAQEKAKKEGYTKRLSFRYGDAEKLPLKDNTFDVVMNRHLLWTLPQPEKALNEWLRVLKPGGKIVIINAAWSTFGLGNKLAAFMGKILIALQEFKNPWSDGYKKSVSEKMPLLTNVEPGKIEDLLINAGFKNVNCVDMKEVCAAEYDALPLRYRLAYKHERYTITGIKE